jgi:hypothetical protein
MLKAAAQIGHPPTAVIFSDPSHKKWTMWDYRLIKAYYFTQDWFRDGIPLWWDESDRVTFDVKARVSKSRAAIERAQEKESKKKSKNHGLYFVAEPRVMDGGELPDREEWFQEQAAKKGNTRVDRRPDGPSIVQGKK